MFCNNIMLRIKKCDKKGFVVLQMVMKNFTEHPLWTKIDRGGGLISYSIIIKDNRALTE